MVLAHVDGFMADVLRTVCRTCPHVLRRGDKKLTWHSIIASGSWDALVEQLVEDYTLSHGMKSVPKRLDALKGELGVDVALAPEARETLLEAEQVRHIFIHNGGRVSAEFLKRTSRTDLSIGQYFPLTLDYLDKAHGAAMQLVDGLFRAISSKYFSQHSRRATAGTRGAPQGGPGDLHNQRNPHALLITDALRSELDATLDRMSAEDYTRRIWDVDPDLWRPEPEHHAEIRNRMGWLTLPGDCMAHADELVALADEVRQAGIERIVLLGMGGSSLAPWCFEQVLGSAPGYPALTVLDSTVPAQVLAATGDTPVERCCFIVASKSGTTAEVRSAFEHFWAQVQARKGDAAGENFIVITDPDTPLQDLGEERGVRRVLNNWPDHGGRYSAMSYFGMVPTALIGAPVEEVLAGGQAMAEACGPDVAVAGNPGAVLGALLGVCHEAGRNKVTMLASPALASFGDWVEQLIAESTGKMGLGLVPVVGEPAGDVAEYGDDRVFAYMRMAGDDTHDNLAEALAAAGHPLIRIDVSDPASIGAEMFRWEFATAVVGALMGVDPFDQPDVEDAKNSARAALEALATSDSSEAPDAESVASVLAELMDSVQPGDYVGLMAYLPMSEETDAALAAMRSGIREAKGVATTLGYGPRFLHSTGQLHKGGPKTGVFIQFTAADPEDVPIPGQEYGFSALKQSQAAGDLQVLRERGQRALRVDLGDNIPAGLARVAGMLEEVL
jgi:glucose-6-phosphate isomerase